jgi:branched-chain amino acid transport system substrate-binding protein
MKKVFFAAVLAVCQVCSASAETIKVGLIAPFSGPFAIYGKSWQEAIDVYRKQHGDSVDGNKVEIVVRDLPEANPAQAKALAQELLIKEKVQYLAGLVFTPDAMAVAPLAQQAKVPLVIFNAATSSIIDKSDYILRSSYTLPQVAVPTGFYAAEQGAKKIVTMVTDYAPGVDAESTFKKAFEARGGTVVESIRMPLSTTDFGPYMQRAKSTAPDGIFTFLPGGPPTYAFVKAYQDNGLRDAKVKFFGTGETQEFDLQQLGDAAIGVNSTFFYSAAHPSKENEDFKRILGELHPAALANPLNLEGYDGIHIIYRMIAATKGIKDGDKAMAAAKALSWVSPRGKMKIDPATRDLVQDIYVREVVRDSGTGKLFNREIKTYPLQPDYGREGSIKASN